MIPYTFVLEPGLKIYKIYCGYWYWGRPSTAELHQDLRDIYSRIRPDWKIDTDEMREKWKDKEDRNSVFIPMEEAGKKNLHILQELLINMIKQLFISLVVSNLFRQRPLHVPSYILP